MAVPFGPRAEHGNYANMQCIAMLKDAYHRFAGAKHSKEHDHAIEMTLVKIARIATGEYNDDHYNDAIGYLRIASNIQIAERTAQPWEGKDTCSKIVDAPTSSSTASSAAPGKDSSVDTSPSKNPLLSQLAALVQMLDTLSLTIKEGLSSLTTSRSVESSPKPR